MEYALLDKIVITRPIIFLCGPYYDRNNRSDRRVILQEKIYNEYKNEYLPLVIDDFLTEENINDESINIQLMEEICAAASYKTYIFLDTMSSATELGIFANSAYVNHVKVYIPKTSDIYNKSNVGYFVREVVLKKNLDKVSFLEYRPGIERKALATDYIVEHYKFVNNKLPLNIEKDIIDDPVFKHIHEHKIDLIDNDIMPKDSFQICYYKNASYLYLNISVRLFFYLTVSIISCEYKDYLNKKDSNFSVFDIDKINNQVKKSIINYIEKNKKEDLSHYKYVQCETILKRNEKELIYHITKFVHVYYLYSQFHSSYLMPNPLGKIIEKINVGAHPYSIFGITECEKEIIADIINYKDKYFEHIIIKRNKKKRDIIKYRNDENGLNARKLHTQMLNNLNKKYNSNEHSYAYKKGMSIKQCVEKHLSSKGFLKYDIKKFFNSIKKERLAECIKDKFQIDDRFKLELEEIIEICFYNENLPLGLVLSPILSDIFLTSFDSKIVEILSDEINITYTRYADDIMISRENIIDNVFQEKINNIIKTQLNMLGLSNNDEKSICINLSKSGDFIKYIGLNLVKGENENYISVGKTYIYEVAKQYLSYNDKCFKLNSDTLSIDNKEKLKDDIFYQRLIIIGKVGFIKQIEGHEGIKKLKNRLKKYKNNLVENEFIE